MADLCDVASFGWAVNDKDEDPCTVASELISLCGTPAFTLEPLENGDTYPPPTVEDQNPCVCSSVVYALVSVCSACQHGHNGSWKDWIANCQPENISPSTSPLTTTTIDIPSWTNFDVQAEPSFNVYQAKNQAASATTASSAASTNSTVTSEPTLAPMSNSSSTNTEPSINTSVSSSPSQSSVSSSDPSTPTMPTVPFAAGVTASSTGIVAQSTTVASAASTPAAEIPAKQLSTGKKESNKGAIAGGTIAGLLIFLILAALFIWWLRRRRRSHTAPSAAYIATYGTSRPPTMMSHRPLQGRSASYVSSANPNSVVFQDEDPRMSGYSNPRGPLASNPL